MNVRSEPWYRVTRRFLPFFILCGGAKALNALSLSNFEHTHRICMERQSFKLEKKLVKE